MFFFFCRLERTEPKITDNFKKDFEILKQEQQKITRVIREGKLKILISEYTQVEAGKTADGDPLILITHSAGNAVVLNILFQLSHSSYNTMALFPRYSINF